MIPVVERSPGPVRFLDGGTCAPSFSTRSFETPYSFSLPYLAHSSYKADCLKASRSARAAMLCWSMNKISSTISTA